MNNQDKNTYVKQQITTTLLELLKEKELSDINIGEITKKAQVSRNSFYRNYADKEDIIKKYLYQLLSEWDNEWKQKNSDSNAEWLTDAIEGKMSDYGVELIDKKYDQYEKEKEMSLTTKRVILIAIIVIVAFILGRLAVRAFMNFLLGGTLFGGNIL